jgi:RNA-binding protein
MVLSSGQKKYLKGRAHKLKPVVFIGQGGLGESVVLTAEQALADHELIKVKFNDFKEKEQKTSISRSLAEKTGAAQVGMIGHIVIFYRPHADPEKRKIQLPEPSGRF